MSDFENAIELTGLTKKYDGFTLNDISFNVPKGSIMGFIGQNGAGKTTTIKAILNIIRADSGTVKIFGMDNIKHEYEIKEDLAAVFDELPFNDGLSAVQLERIMGGIYKSWESAKFREYLERFGLPEKKPFGKFSKGMKMKLQIAAALSHNAKLLIMDEATTGLDPVVRDEILHIFLEYLEDDSNSILMSSHITGDLEKIADSVTFIDRGRLLLSGYKDDILESHGIMKCSRSDYKQVDKSDFISARISDFGAEMLVSDRKGCTEKYSGLVMDNATLDEIMIYYVNAGKKEWS